MSQLRFGRIYPKMAQRQPYRMEDAGKESRIVESL